MSSLQSLVYDYVCRSLFKVRFHLCILLQTSCLRPDIRNAWDDVISPICLISHTEIIRGWTNSALIDSQESGQTNYLNIVLRVFLFSECFGVPDRDVLIVNKFTGSNPVRCSEKLLRISVWQKLAYVLSIRYLFSVRYSCRLVDKAKQFIFFKPLVETIEQPRDLGIQLPLTYILNAIFC